MFELDFLIDFSDEALLAEIRRVSSSLLEGEALTMAVYKKLSPKVSYRTILRRFGTWENALDRAGLRNRFKRRNHPEQKCYENLERVWVQLGRAPTYKEIFEPPSVIQGKTYLYKWGTWRKALIAFVAYINSEETPQSVDAIKDWKIEPTTKHKTRRDINDRLRVRVFVRDNHTCQICGRVPGRDGVVLHVDHIKAYVKGGETVMENLQTLCSKCNLGKGDFDLHVESDREVIDVNV
jgi:hypothetical protein